MLKLVNKICTKIKNLYILNMSLKSINYALRFFILNR